MVQVCVLGSGSGGNCTVLKLERGAMLIDAGFGPQTSRRRLRMAKLELADLHTLCLTHLDRDHFRPTWVPDLLTYGICLCLHRRHVGDLARLCDLPALEEADLLRVFDDEPFRIENLGVDVRPIRLPHDVKGTVGYRLDTKAGSVGYATDLGHVPANLIAEFAGVDLLAIESNYDPEMQRASGRPLFLKRRVMGMTGHLSNQDAFLAVQQIADQSPLGLPRHVVLLHGSRQCNHKRIIQRIFDQDPRLRDRITLTDQRRCTGWLTVRPLKPLAHDQLPLRF